MSDGVKDSDAVRPFSNCNVRVAALEWATDAANGELDRLDWVDSNVDPDQDAFHFTESLNVTIKVKESLVYSDSYSWDRFISALKENGLSLDSIHPNAVLYGQTLQKYLFAIEQVDGVEQITKGKNKKKYSHRPYGYFLPTIMARQAQAAQQNGDPTVLETMLYLYAKVEWMTAARRYFWSPMSPEPKLLSLLAEAYGIGTEIHHNNSQALSRLIAKISTWHKEAGTSQKAMEMLCDIIQRESFVHNPPIKALDYQSKMVELELGEEILSVREREWWEQRAQPDSKTKYRLNKAGFLCFQPKAKESRIEEERSKKEEREKVKKEQYSLAKEDVLIKWKYKRDFPLDFLRLIPMWSSVRMTIDFGETQ